MSDSGVITIMILFQLKGYRCLKHFYIDHVKRHMKDDFPDTVSYYRFVELQKKAMLPMAIFLQTLLFGRMFRDILFGFHGNQGVPLKKRKTEQGLQRYRDQGKGHHGMVLRF